MLAMNGYRRARNRMGRTLRAESKRSACVGWLGSGHIADPRLAKQYSCRQSVKIFQLAGLWVLIDCLQITKGITRLMLYTSFLDSEKNNAEAIEKPRDLDILAAQSIKRGRRAYSPPPCHSSVYPTGKSRIQPIPHTYHDL